jgi:hypothetical protein
VSCVACAEGLTSQPASPLRSYCYNAAGDKRCRRLYITGLGREWYPDGVLDGFYEWDGFATLRTQPFYRFAGGYDICLSANRYLSWAWQPCSDHETGRMGDLGEVFYSSNNWASPVDWSLPADLKTTGGDSTWPVAPPPPTVVCADDHDPRVPSPSPLVTVSPSPSASPSPSPYVPACRSFVMSGFAPTTELGTPVTELGRALNGFYEWDGATPSDNWQPHYRLADTDVCLMSGWYPDVWAWRTCSGDAWPDRRDNYAGFIIEYWEQPPNTFPSVMDSFFYLANPDGVLTSEVYHERLTSLAPSW